MNSSAHGLVDHLFRHSAGQMVATLTRIFGPAHLALAEEVVQDALVAALQQWPVSGVPQKPAAWLFQVARNRALDQVRRNTAWAAKEAEIVAAFSVATADISGSFAHELTDDQLRMMLMCCHPAIAEDSRIALTLKTVGGFSVEEIARAFLTRPDTIAQRIVRAKRVIREEGIELDVPSRDRLDSLLTVLYLMFNEGYSAHVGDDLVRADLCHEAIRLTRIVTGHPVAGAPSSNALLALMLLQAARLPARTDAAGELTTLVEQNRSLWDGAMIADGIRHLDAAAAGDELTAYHVEAAIAAIHSTAPSFDETPWKNVVALYDRLLEIKASPVVALNRAVAIAMSEGPEQGIAAIESIRTSLHDYLPLSSTLGELFLRAGDRERAAEQFRHALTLPSTAPEKRFLIRKLQGC